VGLAALEAEFFAWFCAAVSPPGLAQR